MARGDPIGTNAREALDNALSRAEGDRMHALHILAYEYAKLYRDVSAGYIRDGGPTRKWEHRHKPPANPVLLPEERVREEW